MHRSISKGTKDLLLFKMPVQEAIFLEICSIGTFQVKFPSIYIPRGFVNSIYFIELLSIVKDGGLSKVFNLCLEPININSVFDLTLTLTLSNKKTIILVRSSFIFSST